MKRKTIRIIEFKNNKSSNISFRVSGWRPVEEGEMPNASKLSGDGHFIRIRENYADYHEALNRKQELERIAAGYDPGSRSKTTRLSESQVQEAELAFSELKHGSLLGAVRYWEKHHKEPVQSKPLSDAVVEFIEAKQKSNRRPSTISNLQVRLGKITDEFPGAMVHEITDDNLFHILNRPGISPHSRENDRRVFHNFFRWAAQKRNYRKDNPAALIDNTSVERNVPVCLNFKQCKKLLRKAQLYKEGRLVPYISLALFAGLRPTELSRLSWEEIDLEKKNIRITPGIAKCRSRRNVKINDNLVDWISTYIIKNNSIKPPNFNKDFLAVRTDAGFTVTKDNPQRNWIPDIMRHTAISMHLAKWEDEGKTASWAGNTPDVIHTHYKDLVDPSDVDKFWLLSPDFDEVVEISA